MVGEGVEEARGNPIRQTRRMAFASPYVLNIRCNFGGEKPIFIHSHKANGETLLL